TTANAPAASERMTFACPGTALVEAGSASSSTGASRKTEPSANQPIFRQAESARTSRSSQARRSNHVKLRWQRPSSQSEAPQTTKKGRDKLDNVGGAHSVTTFLNVELKRVER